MKNKKGFTLIEVVLGLSIFALTALTFYAVFSNGLRINERAATSEQLYRELRWSLDTLTLDLENMVPYEGYNSGVGAFEGTEQTISFIRPTAEGLKVIRYSLQSPEQTKVFETRIGERSSKNKPIIINYTEEEKIEFLIREEQPFAQSSDGKADVPSEPEVLSTHIQPGSLRFSYGYRGEEGQAPGLTWKDDWKDIHFPSLVRVELAFVEPGQTQVALSVKKEILIPAGSWGKAEP